MTHPVPGAANLKEIIDGHLAAPAGPGDKVPGQGILARLLRPGINDRDRAEFCVQLAVMLESRVALHRALQVLARQSRNQKMRTVIEELRKDIQRGISFDRALAGQPDVFDNLFVVTAEVGQESGRLGEVLTHLATHLEKMNALARRVRQALTYPALVLTVACFTVVFLLLFIVPSFAGMFKSFQVELPGSTQAILAVSAALNSYGLYGVLGVVVLVHFLRTMLRTPSVRRKAEAYLFKMPLAGDVLLKTHVARFCRTLGTLLQADVSLVDALAVSQRIASNADVREEIGRIIKYVRQGAAIAEQLMDSTLFPPMVVQMIAVGEETSELDSMLLRVADYYEKELDSKVETLSSVLEPVIILFLGLLVAVILVSMYMPMFDLVNLLRIG